MNLTTALGYAGTLLYLANHAYVSLKPDYHPRIYFAGNLIAAVALVTSSAVLFSWQAVFTNLFWALVSLQCLRGTALPSSASIKTAIRPLVLVTLSALAISAWLNVTVALSILAWSSVVIFALAYLFFAAGELEKRHYLWLNFLAATAIIPQLWLDSNYPVLLLECCWAAVSIYGALRATETTRLV